MEGTCAADSDGAAADTTPPNKDPPDWLAPMLMATTSGRPGTLNTGELLVRQETDTTEPPWVAHKEGAGASVALTCMTAWACLA